DEAGQNGLQWWGYGGSTRAPNASTAESGTAMAQLTSLEVFHPELKATAPVPLVEAQGHGGLDFPGAEPEPVAHAEGDGIQPVAELELQVGPAGAHGAGPGR